MPSLDVLLDMSWELGHENESSLVGRGEKRGRGRAMVEAMVSEGVRSREIQTVWLFTTPTYLLSVLNTFAMYYAYWLLTGFFILCFRT